MEHKLKFLGSRMKYNDHFFFKMMHMNFESKYRVNAWPNTASEILVKLDQLTWEMWQ